MSLKTAASSVSTVFSLDHSDTIVNLFEIANTFNNYFVSIAETTKKRHKIFTHKHFSDYLANENIIQYFCNQTTDKEQIANTISSLEPIEAFGPNAIPYRKLCLLKNEIL